MNELALKYLVEEQLEAIYVTNRTHGKMVEMKAIYQEITPIQYEERYSILEKVDFVISATASPHTILQYEYMPKFMKHMDMIDIGMPRDIDERINRLPNVRVYYLDDLQDIAKENSAIREALGSKAEEEIDKALIKLYEWMNRLDVEPMIHDLDSYCSDIKSCTAKFLSKKVNEVMDYKTMEFVITETIKRCMRTPIANLLEIEDEAKREAYANMMGELFKVNKAKQTERN